MGNTHAETAMYFEGRVGRRLNWTLLEKKKTVLLPDSIDKWAESNAVDCEVFLYSS